jgi:membrane protein DedA with SNARE-associated domain
MLFMKIYLTVLIFMSILFTGGWLLSNVDEDREEFWDLVSITSGVILVLMLVGLGLYQIWFL